SEMEPVVADDPDRVALPPVMNVIILSGKPDISCVEKLQLTVFHQGAAGVASVPVQFILFKGNSLKPQFRQAGAGIVSPQPRCLSGSPGIFRRILEKYMILSPKLAQAIGIIQP